MNGIRKVRLITFYSHEDYIRKYNKEPDVIQWYKDRAQTQKFKESERIRARARRQTPEFKAYRKAYDKGRKR